MNSIDNPLSYPVTGPVISISFGTQGYCLYLTHTRFIIIIVELDINLNSLKQLKRLIIIIFVEHWQGDCIDSCKRIM